MPDEIIPAKILEENRRKYAQREKYFFKNYLESLKPNGYTGDGKEDSLRLKAYALTHIYILENTMLDTRTMLEKIMLDRNYLAGLDMPQAHNLFRKELNDLQKAKNHALNGYVDKDITRKILWHEIGDIWHYFNSKIEKLPVIMLDTEEAESAAA